ncbi:hypothetical protein BJ165DRAFT_1445123 [Panaeolus papilionaceus]|nr:hypothetical protein BJ165DRAFT_1445123 [Panaeolus papilionaceus]
MSPLSRLAQLPASRRAYSSFFSSKSGGGRFVNSAKPTKATVVTAKNNTKPDSPSDPKADAISTTSTAADALRSPNTLTDAKSSTSGAAAGQSGSISGTSSTTQPLNLADTFSTFSVSEDYNPQLAVNPKDFKIHQFFSMHRPLLLINQPPSIFRPIPPNHPITSPLQPEVEDAIRQKYGLGGLSSESFIDADAEAARQLTRALTMSKAGATMSWEATLKHLGLDVSKDADRVNLQEQFDKEWNEVLLDSTKRKRRKKMKKHK